MSKSSDWSFYKQVTKSLRRPRPGDARFPTLWPSEASAIVEKNGRSQVVGACRRSTFFRYLSASHAYYEFEDAIYDEIVKHLKDLEVPVSDYMLFIWEQGNLYEDFVIKQAKNIGVFDSEQGPIYIKSHNVSGKRDVEVYDPLTGKLVICEVKSVYGFGANVVLGTPAVRKGDSLAPHERAT